MVNGRSARVLCEAAFDPRLAGATTGTCQAVRSPLSSSVNHPGPGQVGR